MATAVKKTVKKTVKKKLPKNAAVIVENGERKIVSKTWLAALANRGTGEIVDMRAVLK
jgi:hypothetical protein